MTVVNIEICVLDVISDFCICATFNTPKVWIRSELLCSSTLVPSNPVQHPVHSNVSTQYTEGQGLFPSIWIQIVHCSLGLSSGSIEFRTLKTKQLQGDESFLWKLKRLTFVLCEWALTILFFLVYLQLQNMFVLSHIIDSKTDYIRSSNRDSKSIIESKLEVDNRIDLRERMKALVYPDGYNTYMCMYWMYWIRRIINVFMRFLLQTLYLYCIELRNIKLHWINKLWCDRYSLDVICVDVNMYSEEIVSWIISA